MDYLVIASRVSAIERWDPSKGPWNWIPGHKPVVGPKKPEMKYVVREICDDLIKVQSDFEKILKDIPDEFNEGLSDILSKLNENVAKLNELTDLSVFDGNTPFFEPL